MTEIEWVDEVPKRWGPRTKPLIDAEMEAALRSHPGRWAKARKFPGPSSAHQARKRWRENPQHLTPGEWEAEARKFPDGTSAVFMRFVGDCTVEEAQPPPEPAAVDEETEDEANVGPCGPCGRGRCQFCAGHGCECHRSDHFARAATMPAS